MLPNLWCWDNTVENAGGRLASMSPIYGDVPTEANSDKLAKLEVFAKQFK